MRINISICMVLLAVMLSGCGQKDTSSLGIESNLGFNRAVCGRSVEGRDIETVNFGTGENTILFIASIHGTERAGTPLMEKFIQHLSDGDSKLPSDKRIVIIPKLNPDGFDAKTRHNANDIDLNRNFPAENRENNMTNGFFAYSEPESRTLATVIDIYQPQSIIVFHEALNCIDYDGPGQQLANHLGKYCDIPVKKLGARAGSLGAYAGETLGIPTITVEFPASVRGQSAEYMWEKYGKLVTEAY